MHYVIYIPGQNAKSRDLLDTVGLTGLVRPDEPEPHFCEVPNGSGPDAKGGLIILPYRELDPGKAAQNPPLGYLPESQEWMKHPAGKYWLGWDVDKPPQEIDLRRRKSINSRRARLGNEEHWLLPNCYSQHHRMKKTADGWEKSSEYEYDDLHAKAAPIMVMLESAIMREAKEMAGEEHLPADTWDDATCLDFISDLLSINYRLNDFIAGELGLLLLKDLPSLVALATDYERLTKLTAEIQSGN